MSMFQLNGLKALITGGSRGIGKAIAIALYKQGAEVCISGTNQDSLDIAAKDIRESYIDSDAVVKTAVADLSNNDGPQNLYDKVIEEMDHIDILVNNAGIGRDMLLIRMSDDAWNDVMQVNLNAVFKLSKLFSKPMRRRKFGRIINNSSIIAHTGNAGQANYAAAKAGVIAFTKSLALEFATSGITANCIAPGYIKTDMTDSMKDIARDYTLNLVPMKKIGKGEDIAYAAVYLASKEAEYVTGETLNINGGLYMC